MSLPALCEHVKYPPPPSLTITAKSERTQSDIWLNKGPISPSVLAKVIEEHICLKPKISMVYRSIAHRRLGSSIEQGFGEPFEPRFCFSCWLISWSYVVGKHGLWTDCSSKTLMKTVPMEIPWKWLVFVWKTRRTEDSLPVQAYTSCNRFRSLTWTLTCRVANLEAKVEIPSLDLHLTFWIEIGSRRLEPVIYFKKEPKHTHNTQATEDLDSDQGTETQHEDLKDEDMFSFTFVCHLPCYLEEPLVSRRSAYSAIQGEFRIFWLNAFQWFSKRTSPHPCERHDCRLVCSVRSPSFSFKDSSNFCLTHFCFVGFLLKIRTFLPRKRYRIEI